MMCMTELHGGVCHRTSTPHKSGNKMKEKKKKIAVGTAVGSFINMSFRIIAIILVNAVTLANINPESHYFIESTPSFFLYSFMVTTFLLIVW